MPDVETQMLNMRSVLIVQTRIFAQIDFPVHYPSCKYLSEINAELNNVPTKLAAPSREISSAWNEPSKGRGKGPSKDPGAFTSQHDKEKDKRRRM